MAQIGTIRVDTQNNGTVDVPVFETGDSSSDIYEFVRVETASGTGFIPVTDTGNAAYPYLRVQSENNGIVAITDTKGSTIPESDAFQDGEIASVWNTARPSSVSESAGDLTVEYSDHQGDYLPSSGNPWELVYQEGDFPPFRVEARADNAFNGTDDQKVHIGIEGANGTRYAGGWGHEGSDTFRGFEYVGGEDVERDAGAETSDELWIRLDWDGSSLTLYTERGSSFSSWTLHGSVSPNFTAPIKVGLVGNNNTVAWRYFDTQTL